jgi:hypothetical protein
MTKGSASVSITEAELILLNNALNEVLSGLDVPEFDTRFRSICARSGRVTPSNQPDS